MTQPALFKPGTKGTGKRPAPVPRRRSAGEAAFWRAWTVGTPAGSPRFVEEYCFCPDRRYRFDFAFPAFMVAVEIDGGQWKAGGGRHNSDADRDKLNLAASLGWRVLRFSPTQVRTNGAGCVKVTMEALGVTAAVLGPGKGKAE